MSDIQKKNEGQEGDASKGVHKEDAGKIDIQKADVQKTDFHKIDNNKVESVHTVAGDKKEVTGIADTEAVVSGDIKDKGVDKKADAQLAESSIEKTVGAAKVLHGAADTAQAAKALDGTADTADEVPPLVFHKSPVLRGRNRSHTVSKPGLLSALLSGELRHGLDGDMAATTFNLNALKEEKEKKEQEKKE